MGTHPIFESDFDCLTDLLFVPKKNMEVALEEIIYNRDPPAELTNDLLGIVDPRSGKTLIELAVILGRSKFIEKMIKMKPDLISSVGHCGHSVLALACLWGQDESVDALFKAGADFTKPESEESDETPLDLAVKSGHGHLVKLVDDLAIEAANNKGKKGAKKGKK